MNKIYSKMVFSIIQISLILLLTSCEIPIISQFLDDHQTLYEENDSDFPLTTGQTDFHLSPVSDVECIFYVALGGDDHNSGSKEQPWGSFQGATKMANPGDTVCFRGGTYTTEEIHLSKSGGEDALITFAAYPGETPILDGDDLTYDLLVLNASVSYIRISGFALNNFRNWGIFLTGDNRFVILDHLDIEGGEAGIRFTYAESSEAPPLEGPVEHILLENSLVHGSQYSAVDCTPGPCNHMTIRSVEIYNTGLLGDPFYGSDGLEFARGHHVIVEDCYVHDNGGDGIDLGSRDREGNIDGVIVRRNHVIRNHLNGIKVWAGGRIESNVIWGSGNSAIWSGVFNCDIEIINNSVAYNLWDENYASRNWAVVIGYPEALEKPDVNLTMVNNIFAFNADPLEGGSTGVYLGPGVKLVGEGGNIYFSRPDGEITIDIGDGLDFSREDIVNGVWASYSGQGNGNLISDPIFLSGWPNVDLHLRSTSPAINAGISIVESQEDIEGNLRGDQPDIGAYEE